MKNVECYVPGDDRFPPCYDELVVKEGNQVLPIAVIHIGEPRVREDGFHGGGVRRALDDCVANAW